VGFGQVIKPEEVINGYDSIGVGRRRFQKHIVLISLEIEYAQFFDILRLMVRY